MSRPPLSIIINNYNYGRFIAQAIESALKQTAGDVEVIVVDDGSTDDSRDVIARYARDATVILKENGGQASAFNRGVEASRGDVIIFLDSDDALFPTAGERAIAAFDNDRIAKVHWPLLEINEAGERTGKKVPPMALPEGDQRDCFIREGPWSLPTPPTSGNAWSRRFLERIGPVPEQDYRICADAFLIALAPVAGLLRAIEEPLGLYRLHRSNHYYAKPFIEALRRERWVFDLQSAALRRFLAEEGVALPPDAWKRNAWVEMMEHALAELESIIPRGSTYILVDDAQWPAGKIVEGARLPFTERDGEYWGPPRDDEHANAELDRLRRELGGQFLVFAWPAFWWLTHYQAFHDSLVASFPRLLNNERLVVFDLR